MRSGWLVYTGKDETIYKVDHAFAGREPSGARFGSGWLLPMSKGMLYFPDKSIYNLAAKGDLYAIGKLVAAYAKEFLIPIPGSLDTVMKIGEKVADVLNIDVRLPQMADYETESAIRDIQTDPLTIPIPYVDIVDWRINEFMGQQRAYSLTAEDAEGNKRDFCFVTEYDNGYLDIFLEARWQQEFQNLVVEIVDGVLGGESFWEQARAEVVKEGYSFEQQPLAKELRLNDLRVENTPQRFYLGGNEYAASLIGWLVEQRLEAAGYKQAEAISGVYLYEDIGGNLLTTKWVPPQIVWVLALTDQKLATEVRERMAPNIDAWRDVLRDNSVIHTMFKMDYVEMLERCARGESLGRVQSTVNGPWY
jgi:hypothetical protein